MRRRLQDGVRFLSSLGGGQTAVRRSRSGRHACRQRSHSGAWHEARDRRSAYPPFVGSGGHKNRASRWYGDKQRSKANRPAESHPDAADWDEPSRHRKRLADLQRDYDGLAIATSADGIAAYGELPPEARLLAWVKPNAQPGAHRLRSIWEASHPLSADRKTLEPWPRLPT